MKQLLTLILSSALLSACAASPAKSPTTPASAPATVMAPAQPATFAALATAGGNQAPEVRARVRTYLQVRRDLNQQRLTAYSAKGSFPKNRVRPGMLNVFIDDAGAICAAANLMFQDGHQDLVRATAKRDNYLRLATVQSGPLMDWMLLSGLTQSEIADVQEPYSFIEDDPEPRVAQRAIDAEVQRLQSHFAGVVQRLERQRETSLDAMTDRVMKRPDLVAAILKS